jgi:hypothetical protein
VEIQETEYDTLIKEYLEDILIALFNADENDMDVLTMNRATVKRPKSLFA